jgi:hypothetical protein
MDSLSLLSSPARRKPVYALSMPSVFIEGSTSAPSVSIDFL